MSILALISWLFLIIYYYFVHGNMDKVYVVVAVAYILFGWWLGKQYDIAMFYSEKDSLTQVYNRRFILDMLPKLLSKIDRRKKESLTLLIVDVDRFKEINDTYGHNKGDFVLKSISDVLRACIREGDFVVRWGGDEFLIVAPNVDKKSTVTMINHIEVQLKEASRNLQLTLSLSIGVATYPEDSTNIDELIKIADNKMYVSKLAKRRNSEVTFT